MSSDPGPWYAAMSGARTGPIVSFGAVVCVRACVRACMRVCVWGGARLWINRLPCL